MQRKNRTKIKDYSVLRRELSISLFCVTGFAVNRLAFFWLEWNFAFLTAFSTNCFEHLAWSEISSGTPLIKISHVTVSKLT